LKTAKDNPILLLQSFLYALIVNLSSIINWIYNITLALRVPNMILMTIN